MTPSETKSAYTPEECREMLKREILTIDKKKISNTGFGITVGIIVAMVTLISTLTFQAYDTRQEKQEDSSLYVAQLQQEVVLDKAIMKKDIEHIKTDVTDIKTSVKRAEGALVESVRQQSLILELLRQQSLRTDSRDKIEREREALSGE